MYRFYLNHYIPPFRWNGSSNDQVLPQKYPSRVVTYPYCFRMLIVVMSEGVVGSVVPCNCKSERWRGLDNLTMHYHNNKNNNTMEQ